MNVVIVRYHIPRDGQEDENRVTVIARVPGQWDRPAGAIVDEIVITDDAQIDAAVARHPAGKKL